MFRRILIPTDFSTAAEWVFADAVRIATLSNAELLILHVRMTWGADPQNLRFPADPALYEYAERQELERLRDRVVRANASLVTRLIVRHAPDPGSEIGRTAKAEGADLIVIATHARHHVAHLLIGSTTMKVLAEPPAPLLAIRYGTHLKSPLSRLVVPVHMRQHGRAALDLATRIGKEIHLVTICSEAEHSEAAKFQQQIAATIPSATTEIVRGDDPQKEIIKYAQKIDADAIFVNARGKSEGKLDIIRAAGVPVMIVPVQASV